MAEYCNDNFLMIEDNEDSFRMWQGLVGPHYTPIVDNDGTLRWTNDGMLPNPDSVNLRGPQGAGLTIGGIRETAEELPAQAPPGVLWLVGTESPFESYSFISGEWIDLGLCYVGPAGPPGPQGDDYMLTPADKTEIAGEAEQILLNDLNNNPLPVSRGGTGAQTLNGAKETLGITDLEDQIGDTPLATDAQDIRGAINELEGTKVNKSGDTMQGDLIEDGGDFKVKNEDFEDGITQGQTTPGQGVRFFDKNNKDIGGVYPQFHSNGDQGTVIRSIRRIGNTSYENALNLRIKNDGSRTVGLSDAAAWLTALGLGSVTSESVSENIATAGTDCEITSAYYWQWGKIAMLLITVKKTEAVATSVTTTLATLVSGKRPAGRAIASVVNNINPLKASIFDGGAIAVFGTISAGESMTVASTYLLP